jgi:hypothetical protein
MNNHSIQHFPCCTTRHYGRYNHTDQTSFGEWPAGRQHEWSSVFNNHPCALFLPAVISPKDIYFLPYHIFIRSLFNLVYWLRSTYLSSLSLLGFLFFIKSVTFNSAGNRLRIQVRPLFNSLLVDVDAIATGTRLNVFVQTAFTVQRFV